MHALKRTLGFLCLILAVFLAAFPWLTIPLGLTWSSAILMWILALFAFDLGLEWRFAMGIAPWWWNLPATEKQKAKAHKLGLKYPEHIRRNAMADMISKAEYHSREPSIAPLDARLHKVYSATSIDEANRVKAELEKEGIESMIVDGQRQSTVKQLPHIATARELWVCVENPAAAHNILSAYSDNPGENTRPSATPWKCTECGEMNEPTFDLCWKCQSVRTRSV